MKNLFALILFLLLLSQGFAQEKDTLVILPGSNKLQSSRLHDYISSYDLLNYKNGEQKLVGSIDDHFQIDRKKKQALRVAKIIFGSNIILDSGLCLLAELAPVYHRSIQTTKVINLSFNDEKVTGKITFKTGDQKIEAIDYKCSVPLFDSYYEDILAKTLNIKEGVLFRFPEYIYERGGIVWSTGELVKSENKNERVVKFYELNTKREIVRTTTYVIDTKSNEILSREYLTGNNRIVMRKKSS